MKLMGRRRACLKHGRSLRLLGVSGNRALAAGVEVLRRLLEEALQHEGFAQEHLDFTFREAIRGHLLQEEGYGLKVHGLQPRTKVGGEARAEIDEESLEARAAAIAVPCAPLRAARLRRLC